MKRDFKNLHQLEEFVSVTSHFLIAEKKNRRIRRQKTESTSVVENQKH